MTNSELPPRPTLGAIRAQQQNTTQSVETKLWTPPTTGTPARTTGEAQKKLYAAIVAAQGDVSAVAKEGRRSGRGGNYAYRQWDDLVDALNTALSDHGLFFTYNDIECRIEEIARPDSDTPRRTATIQMQMLIIHKDGGTLPANVYAYADDYGDKAATKARTGAAKEWLSRTFMVPFNEDTDPETTPTPAPDRQTERIHARIRTLHGKLDETTRETVRGWMAEQEMPDTVGALDKDQAAALETHILSLMPKPEKPKEPKKPAPKPKEPKKPAPKPKPDGTE